MADHTNLSERSALQSTQMESLIVGLLARALGMSAAIAALISSVFVLF